jgi:hypothetical protein
VKSTNWSVKRALSYLGKFVYQEGLNEKGGVQASIRYSDQGTLKVDLSKLGGFEDPIGSYELKLDPAAVQKATAGLKFGSSAYGNAMEELAVQRVAQATGQTPVIRPPQLGGADFLPVQTTIRILDYTF